MTQAGYDSPAAKNGFFLRHERSIFCLVAAALLGVSAWLHFWRLGSVPPGFTPDESANAYNAYCISQTGADEYGTRFPVFFRCQDDYRDCVPIYSMVPLVKAFGLKRDVSRFPSAFFLILASVAFALLVQQYCRNKWLSALGGFCFSILPWVFVVSRFITAAYTAMLLGMIMGWLLMLLALEGRSYRCAIAAGGAWAFVMYSYYVGRPMTILLLICFCVAYFRVLRTRWKVGLVFVVSWVGMLAPMIVSVARTPLILTTRFQTISIFQDHPTWDEAFSRLASRYVEYFSPQFLFFRGDANLRQHSGFGGELFLFLIPMILTGVYCLVRFFRSEPGYRFVGLGLLVYPAAAVLTIHFRHSGRTINGVIFWALTAAIGAHFLWQRRGIGRRILVVACCVGIVEVGLYMRDYFGHYPARSREAFDAAFTEALEDCFHAANKDETVYVSSAAVAFWKPTVTPDFKPVVYEDILFFGKIDPRAYQERGIPKDRVCFYDGTISKPGLLLTCNVRLVDPAVTWTPPSHEGDGVSSAGGALFGVEEVPTPLEFEMNHEPKPVGAELLETKPLWCVSGHTIQYEVYRVK